MKNRSARITQKRLHIVTFTGILILAGAALIVPFYSARSGSVSHRALAKTPTNATTSNKRVLPTRTTTAMTLSADPFLFVQSIATFDNATCSVPQTDFNLGDTVCVKASGVPTSLFPWQVNWVGPSGFIRESDSASIDDTTEYRYLLPSTSTDVINGETVENFGRWRVNLAKANGAIQQTAFFTVHEVGNPQADVLVQKFQRDSNNAIHAGDNAAFIVVVQNAGPDPAASVHLVDSAPAGATLVSFTQNSGPACVQQDPNDCIIATMTNGDRAEFTMIYGIGGGTSPGTYQTSATVSSTTPDPNSDNNSATVAFEVQSGSAGGGACELTCPSDVFANANTTEGGQRGAHVTFDDAVGTGTCGSITATPASGSFFPVGTTPVTVTSETGDGSCTFTVEVEESNGNVSISCPANITANADSNCEATVTVGNPTVTGTNVTFHGVRSDGKPMYNCDCFPNSPDQADDACDVNGACSRRTDAPFPAGTTTITWLAFSHDTPGPYATPDDEIAHRTGSTSCNQTITINDVTPPTISATNSSASADANCQAPVPDYSNTVDDNCACASSDTSDACAGHPHITYSQSPAAGTMVGLGPTTVHITANDNSSNNSGAGNTTTKDVTFTVNDTTAPMITCPANITTNTLPGTCSAIVVTGTATATDNCDSTPTITATRSDGQSLVALYPKGTTTITWRATDDAGNYSECTQTVTVVDNEAPTITFNGQTPSMWPPNHEYQTFTAANFIASVSDNCDSLSINDVAIISATSDEVENGGGDGNTLNDIVIAADCKSIQLRAERQNAGNGRVYTITFRLRDTSGNTTTGTAKVYSPKNQGETPGDDGPHYAVTGSCP